MSVCIAGGRGRSRRADLGAGFRYRWTRLLASIRHIGVNVRQGGDKARKHPANNPYALFRSPIAIEDVWSSPMSGAPAAVMCSNTFARRRDVDYGIVIAATAMRTDRKSSFEARDMTNIVGYDLAETTARAPRQIDGARAALHHNLGLGGARVAGVYQRV